MPELEPFAISLTENGLHSLRQGIDLYNRYLVNQDKMQLRDAIMFLHHGVELLMKQILVKKSEFLIFQDLARAARKQQQANTREIGIFLLPAPPHTVTFEEAITRVQSFIRPPELTPDLLKRLMQLNHLRNQLEHYAIETDLDQSTKLLASLHEPLLDLFEAQIGGVRRAQTRATQRAWRTVQGRADTAIRLEGDVAEVMRAFAGQTVPGSLFGVDGQLTLPAFSQVLAGAALLRFYGLAYPPDLIGEGEEGTWIVEVKGHAPSTPDFLHHVRSYRNAYVHGQYKPTKPVRLWFVVFSDDISHLPASVRKVARELDILVTAQSAWQALKELLGAQQESPASSSHPEQE